MVWARAIRRRDQVACLTSCMVSSVSLVALTTLVTLFATSILTPSPIQTQALAAAVLDILALAGLLIFTLVQFWRSHRFLLWSQLQRWIIVLTVIAPSIAASILSIYVLAWMHNNRLRPELVNHDLNTPQQLNAAIAMWVISLIAQAAFYTMSFLQAPSSLDNIITSSETGVFSVDSPHKDPISMAVFRAPSSSYPRSIPESPTFSTVTTSPLASVRNSMTSFLRPTTSRSRLVPIRGESFTKEVITPTPELASEPIRHEDGFETWEVELRADPTEPISPSPCAQPPRLETIPGSRPVSPAHPLDGPFNSDPEPIEEAPISALSSNKSSFDTSIRSYHDARADPLSLPTSPSVYMPLSPTFPNAGNDSPITRSFTPPFAVPTRRPSGPNDQSHIHPLFRTDSPEPPPMASPGTIFTASPWGGQVLPADSEYGRGRKNSVFSRYDGSRPSSPASLRPGSSRSTVRSPALLKSYSQGDLKAAQRSVSATDKRPPMPEPAFLAHRRQLSS